MMADYEEMARTASRLKKVTQHLHLLNKMAEQASQGKKVDCSMSVEGEKKAKIDIDGYSSFLSSYLYGTSSIKADPEGQVQISLSNALALRVMDTMQQALMEERDYLLEKLKYVL